MKEVKSSLDLNNSIQEIDAIFHRIGNSAKSPEAFKEFTEFAQQYFQLRYNIVTLNVKLSKLEVEARRTKKFSLVEDQLKLINDQLLFLEQQVVFMSLGM